MVLGFGFWVFPACEHLCQVHMLVIVSCLVASCVMIISFSSGVFSSQVSALFSSAVFELSVSVLACLHVVSSAVFVDFVSVFCLFLLCQTFSRLTYDSLSLFYYTFLFISAFQTPKATIETHNHMKDRTETTWDLK